MEAIGISIFQPLLRSETPAARLSYLDIAAERASEKDSSVLICPELFLLGSGRAEDVPERAEAVSGEYAERVAEIAFLHDICLIYGYPEKRGEQFHNAAACVTQNGTVLANHRKNNLGTDTAQAVFTAGDGITMFEFESWRIALFFDAETELPDLAHAAVMAGAQLFIVVAGPDGGRPIDGKTLLATRAFESKTYLAFATYAKDASGQGSAIFDPTGGVVAGAGYGQEILTARLNPDSLTLARQGVPFINDRRPFTDDLF